jgi:hypothetical protein
MTRILTQHYPRQLQYPHRNVLLARKWFLFFVFKKNKLKILKLFRKPYWNLKLESNIIINERAMSLVLPPHPNIELSRSKLFNDFYLKFECLLMKNIPIDWTTSSLNKQYIRSLFNSLVIEFKMMILKPESGVINEQLFVKFGNIRDESYLMNCLMKLFKMEIDEKLKLKKEDVLENCAQIYKDYIIKLIGSNRLVLSID